MSSYPHSPGHRGVDTSIAAAQSIAPVLPELQRQVLATIVEAGRYGATSDEIASRLGWAIHRPRPRLSELRRLRRIIDSGRRRESKAGIASIVWISSDLENREVVP